MIVTCEKCKAAFNLQDRLVKPEGVRVRCSKCRHVFTAHPPSPAPETPPEEKPEPARSAAPSITHEEQTGIEETIFFDPSADFGQDAPPDPKPRELVREPTPPATPAASPTRSAEKSDIRRKKKYTPFRTKLIYFAAALIGFIAFIVIPLEVNRPIKTLRELIDNAKHLIGGVQAGFVPEELDRMNRFALAVIETPYDKVDPSPAPAIYYSMAFNMILLEGGILPEEEITGDPDHLEEFSEDPFDYQRLLQAGAHWTERFARDPGIEDLLRKYKMLLVKAKENAIAAGFDLSEIMIMIDTGQKQGFFKDNIAYVLESVSWYSAPTHIGETYPIPPDTEFWRKSALTGHEGYDSNMVADPDNWYLPQFDEDEWGAWFSVWLTKKTDNIYNIFNIDFNAADVKKEMFMVAATVISVILVLGVMVVFVARWLSNLVTRPITELTRGAAEVSKGNYAYEVPVLKDDEFGELTRQFNQMTQGQQQRLNLMETLEKVLSKELAQKAAESGLVLGGQKAECTIMFTDFAGFSTITQKMTAVEAVNVLNSYYEGLIPVVKKYGGFPDKYIGDAIVALFGAPIRLDDHAERAVACAIEMQWKMREINEKRRREGRTVFEMRIGLNSGEVIAGAIGCDQKLEYTSIGEATNLANRMEAICEIGHIMIAEGTFDRIKEIFFERVHISRTPKEVQVKGYPEPVKCYSIYVDNLSIDKDLDADGPIRSYYLYAPVDHKIKLKPEDVKQAVFTSAARYL